MKNVSLLFVLTLILSSLITSCSSYRLDSGQYTMTLKLGHKEETLSKTVFLKTEGKKITIESEGSEKTLTGSISGNELRILQNIDSKKIEFLGTLIQDNTVEGNAKQITDEEVDFNATFTLVKAAE